MLDLGYNISHFKTLGEFRTRGVIVDTFEYNLKNVVYEPLLQSVDTFFSMMTKMFESDVTLGYDIGYAFLTCIIALTILQMILMIIGLRMIYNQAELFLHIPVGECVKLQKNSMIFYDEIRTFNEFSREEHSEGSLFSFGQELRNQNVVAEYKKILGLDNAEPSYAKREIESGFFQKYDCSLGIALPLALTVAMMLVYFIGGTVHLNILRDVNEVFHKTARFDQVFISAENYQRFFFYFRKSRSDKNRCYFLGMSGLDASNTTLETVERYQAISHDVIDIIYQVCVSMLLNSPLEIL